MILTKLQVYALLSGICRSGARTEFLRTRKERLNTSLKQVERFRLWKQRLRLVCWSSTSPTWESDGLFLILTLCIPVPLVFVAEWNPEAVAPYQAIGNDVCVHPHLWVHADQVPPEGFAPQLFSQGLPCSDVPNVDPWVLHREANTEMQPPQGTVTAKPPQRGFWESV